MINSEDKLIRYLNGVVSGIFKILPLYEEKNSGLYVYIDSLLFTLYGLDEVVDVKYSDEYLTVLCTLESIKKEIIKEDSRHATVKRETFKCISIVKTMVDKLREGV